MKVKILAVALVVVSSPSWAIYKCTANGKTSFQETPCIGATSQTDIKPLYAAPPVGSTTSAASTTSARPSIDEQNAQYEKERLSTETSYALRDKRTQLDNFRARCTAEVNAIAARRAGFNDNVAGAMRGQAEAAAANAYATNCSTQARAIESELEELRRRCEAQKCKQL